VILAATHEVPRRLSHPSRKTIGLRVPENAITLALLEELGQPLIGTTLQLPGDEHMLSDPAEVQERLGKQIDLVVDGGAGTLEATTVIDLTGPQPALLRAGRGDPAAFGL
jgi:tRNA threonylcarbamoyl adenosine modification protein (Sua5/YciO/YrdC/YwlC family)